MDRVNDLYNKLAAATQHNYEEVIAENADQLKSQRDAFTEYMRRLAREKGIRWVELAEKTGISKGEMYKTISLEKKTLQRDKIILIGIAMELSLQELQHALILYGFSPLYIRRKRDLVLIKMLQEGIYDVEIINGFLLNTEEEPLQMTKRNRK